MHSRLDCVSGCLQVLGQDPFDVQSGIQVGKIQAEHGVGQYVKGGAGIGTPGTVCPKSNSTKDKKEFCSYLKQTCQPYTAGVDIGGGDGRMMAIFALMSPGMKWTGIELSKGRTEFANRMFALLQRVCPKFNCTMHAGNAATWVYEGETTEPTLFYMTNNLFDHMVGLEATILRQILRNPTLGKRVSLMTTSKADISSAAHFSDERRLQYDEKHSEKFTGRGNWATQRGNNNTFYFYKRITNDPFDQEDVRYPRRSGRSLKPVTSAHKKSDNEKNNEKPVSASHP